MADGAETGDGTRAARRGPRRVRPFDPADAARYPALIGCDEVGRGALCGPVVVAAVWFDPGRIPPNLLGALDDSKRLIARERVALDVRIRGVAQVAVAARSAGRIDREGIRPMTLDAMACALRRLGIAAPVRVDGLDAPPGVAGDVGTVVRGDCVVPQIAAASIVAKVARDRLMARLAVRHPQYRWETNVGYGTAEHLAALRAHGPTRHHRQTFRPVADRLAATVEALAGAVGSPPLAAD